MSHLQASVSLFAMAGMVPPHQLHWEGMDTPGVGPGSLKALSPHQRCDHVNMKTPDRATLSQTAQTATTFDGTVTLSKDHPTPILSFLICERDLTTPLR